ncbi:acetyl-CoA C-acyltransferase [Mycobacterium sp. CVI_P3]|uniref:Acetyl-CoA C-acyltransferase n=1 Tax=Mycobacterium pinniadriaticum TaxID=2994102 RepID=A0ABT3SNQ5_9MYCO|nr:acetyl-CoA C-acyltransferase [Mycobacterium pinniadriaticum]MCX2934737.1 acetyl-CoA C-acyltransferase [Mycobacterium pinniadriaticum]MCX2941159.1 acetyl-CoA C-acyltransferase [Mycobacterium pinniadriaticum]
MADVVILEAVRTPIGKRNGSLAKVESPDLLGDLLIGMFARTDLDPALVEQVIVGCVNQVGQQSGNIARNAWLGAGLPLTTGASTTHAQCGSSQQATTLAHALLRSELLEVAVAAGVESMSQVPMQASAVPEYGTGRNDRYKSWYEVTTQFEGAERIAERWGLDRSELDEFALASQERAATAISEGRFTEQVVPVTVPAGSESGHNDTRIFDRDECPRPSTLEGLASLKPTMAERTPALHTAGTSSQIADGASALLLSTSQRAQQLGIRPIARIVDTVLVGSDPVLMLTGPIPATEKLLRRNGLGIDDIDHFEVNEAFASVVLAWRASTGADIRRVNVNGGAIALGHPLGATGAMLITKTVHELARTGGRYGLITMCCGGGLGTGTIVERI